jgi:hypothetical protein
MGAATGGVHSRIRWVYKGVSVPVLRVTIGVAGALAAEEEMIGVADVALAAEEEEVGEEGVVRSMGK